MPQSFPPPESYLVVVPPDRVATAHLDLEATWRSLWSGWYILLGAAVGFALLAAVYAFFLATPIYASSALIAIRSSDQASGGAGSSLQSLASLAGVNLRNAGSQKEIYIAILSSRTVVQKLIEQEDLLPVLYPDKYDFAKKAWKDKPPTMGQALDYFTTGIRTVNEDEKTSLVTVRVMWKDPATAAAWASQLVKIANQTVRQKATREANRNIDFLEKERQHATYETVRESILRLTEANMKQAMMAQVQDDYAYEVIDPPEVPEQDKFIKPRRTLDIAIGLLFGLFAAATFLLWRDRKTLFGGNQASD